MLFRSWLVQFITGNDDNILLLPITNLFTKENNETAYLSKFINNLLRNHNIQTSIFKETHSTIYYTDHYNLSETEILILESMLFNYIDSLGEIVKRNKYIEFRGFEDLTPNEIFQLIDSQPVEKENSEINLSYNTNSSKNSSASSKKVEHDLFGILPEQEVEQITEILKRKNLMVLTHTYVKRVLLESGVAVGVEVKNKNGQTEIYNCNKEVIVSAGTIQSPQILMLSGIGDVDRKSVV